MALPPGEEDVDYNGFRLEIRRFGSGWRIFVYALEGFLVSKKFQIHVNTASGIKSSPKRKP